MAALKAEIEELKQRQQKINTTEAKTHEETTSTSEHSKTAQHPKYVQKACEEDQLEKVELLILIAFIEETMETLATYGKQLENYLDINLI